jgi:hypothetical protein
MTEATTQQDEPSAEQIDAWFEVLHRLALLQKDDPMAPAFAPEPLRQDIADCVARGWVKTWTLVGQEKAGKLRLLLTPEGREVYAEVCQALADEGRPVTGWSGHADAPS